MLDNTTYTYGQRPQLVRRLIWVVIGLILIGLLYWVSTLSFITVSVDGSGATEYRITALSGNPQSFTSGGSVRRVVKKGSYDVTVRRANTSFVKAVKTRGFFGTTAVTGTLVKERSRSFVGNKPLSCYQYVINRLYSYDCGRTFASTVEHLPATDKAPTIARRIATNNEAGVVEGTIATKEGSLALVRSSTDDDAEEDRASSSGGHLLYLLGDNFKVLKRVPVGELDQNASYQMRAVENGFIVYKSDFSHTLFFSDTGAKPIKIGAPKPKNTALKLLDVDVKSNSAAFLFGTDPNREAKKFSSELILTRGSETIRKTNKRGYQSILFCEQKLCANDGTQLDVFDISGSKLRQTLSVGGVTDSMRSPEGTLLIRHGNIVRFNTDSGTGFVEFPITSDYTYSGIKPTADGYIVVLDKRSSNQRVALKLLQPTEDTDQIDAKISRLEQLRAINAVSVYGKYIYISANYGALQPINNGEYGYDPTVKAAADAEIEKTVRELGLNTLGYKIINNLR
jgi:hypothetical protein